jgi:hypothetical protein
MTMNNLPSRRITRLLATIAGLGLLCLVNLYLSQNKLWFYETGTNQRAFLSLTWLMSEKEVERATSSRLSPPEKLRYLDFKDPAWNHLKIVCDSSERLRGLEGPVDYLFFDDKLFGVIFHVRQLGFRILDSLVLEALTAEYGPSTKQIADSNAAFHSWSTSTERIIYAAMDHSDEGRRWATGTIEIVYSPLKAQMDSIGHKFLLDR